MENTNNFNNNAEHSIMKKFRREIWNTFVHAVKKYELIKENDAVCVCISGGKDSMLLAKLMQMLHRYSDYTVYFKISCYGSRI